MNILIITHHFPPLNTMGANRLYAFAKEWKRLGHDVTVLTTKKYRFDGKIDYIPKDTIYSDLDIIEVTYSSWFTKKFEFDNRDEIEKKQFQSIGFMHLMRFMIRKIRQKYIGLLFDIHDLWVKNAINEARSLFQKKKYDFIFSSYSPSSVHKVASKLKKIHPTLFWVADYRDLWSGNPYYESENFFSRLQKQSEKKMLSEADMVTTVSKPWEEYLQGFLKKPTFTIMNGYDIDSFKEICPMPFFPNDGIKRVIYTGTFYPKKQNILPYFKALKMLVNEGVIKNNFQTIFYGDIGDMDGLIADYNIKKYIKIEGFISREYSLRAQRDADGLLYLGWEGEKNLTLNAKGVLSAKVFEYISSGTEIFAIGGRRDSDASKWILTAKAGEIYMEDVIAIYKALKRLIVSGKQKMQIDTDVLNSCRRDVQAKILLDIISEEKL